MYNVNVNVYVYMYACICACECVRVVFAKTLGQLKNDLDILEISYFGLELGSSLKKHRKPLERLREAKNDWVWLKYFIETYFLGDTSMLFSVLGPGNWF